LPRDPIPFPRTGEGIGSLEKDGEAEGAAVERSGSPLLDQGLFEAAL
jgi:hypothetical protein